jgi:hypothetical protein
MHMHAPTHSLTPTNTPIYAKTILENFHTTESLKLAKKRNGTNMAKKRNGTNNFIQQD